MSAIKAGVLNETSKLLSLRKYKALLVLTCLVSIAIGLLGSFSKGLIGLSLSNTPLTVLSIATGFIIPLMIAMAAADLFTAEQENGSIRVILTRPVSRLSVFISKGLAILIFAILSLVVCLVTSLVCSLVLNGTGLTSISEALLAYTVSIVPMLPIILFAVAVSQLCKNSSSTVMLSVFAYIIIIAAGLVFANLAPMLFSSYTGWYKLFIGAAMPITRILYAFVLLVAYILIFFAFGSWVFERKEY
jgi:ABC-2 type transport system permease protein